MRDFGWILNAYGVANAQFEYNISQSEKGTHPILGPALTSDFNREKEVNDHAYFCLLFFQFEDFIKTSFASLVRSRLNRASGADQVAWERVGGQRLDILSMIRFLLPDDSAAYGRIKDLYSKRNKIAHEAVLSASVDMTAVPDDLEIIADTIQTALSDLEAAP